MDGGTRPSAGGSDEGFHPQLNLLQKLRLLLLHLLLLLLQKLSAAAPPPPPTSPEALYSSISSSCSSRASLLLLVLPGKIIPGSRPGPPPGGLRFLARLFFFCGFPVNTNAITEECLGGAAREPPAPPLRQQGHFCRVYTAQLEAPPHQPANKQEGRRRWPPATLVYLTQGCWCESRRRNKLSIHKSAQALGAEWTPLPPSCWKRLGSSLGERRGRGRTEVVQRRSPPRSDPLSAVTMIGGRGHERVPGLARREGRPAV